MNYMNQMVPQNQSMNYQMIPQGYQQGFMNQNALNNGVIPRQQSQPQQSNFFGKIVDSIETVKIADVPMDGNSYVFPKADGTEIYTKRWLPNFTTDVSVYVKVMQDENIIDDKETFSKEKFEELSNSLVTKLSDMFDERISKLEKALPQNMNKNGGNK